MSARMVDQNAAHDVRRNPKEVCAVLPCDAVLVYQSKIRFVDQGSGLQSVVWTFAAKVACRHSVKFVVDGGKKLVQNAFVPLSPLYQQSGHFVRFHSVTPELGIHYIRRYSQLAGGAASVLPDHPGVALAFNFACDPQM